MGISNRYETIGRTAEHACFALVGLEKVKILAGGRLLGKTSENESFKNINIIVKNYDNFSLDDYCVLNLT